MPNKIGPQGPQGSQGYQGVQGAQGAAATGTASSLGFMTGSVETEQAIPATSAWSNLATVGPSVTLNFTGSNSSALVIGSAQMRKDSSWHLGMIGFSITGSSTQSDVFLARHDNAEGAAYYSLFGMTYVSALNSGSNVFTMRYYANGSTWYASKRRLVVIPL